MRNENAVVYPKYALCWYKIQLRRVWQQEKCLHYPGYVIQVDLFIFFKKYRVIFTIASYSIVDRGRVLVSKI